MLPLPHPHRRLIDRATKHFQRIPAWQPQMLGRQTSSHLVWPLTGLRSCRGETRRQRVRHDMSSSFVRILSRSLCRSWQFAVSQL